MCVTCVYMNLYITHTLKNKHHMFKAEISRNKHKTTCGNASYECESLNSPVSVRNTQVCDLNVCVFCRWQCEIYIEHGVRNINPHVQINPYGSFQYIFESSPQCALPISFSHVQLSLFVSLEQTLFIFLFGYDFPTGATLLGNVGKIMHRTSKIEKTLDEWALPCAKLRHSWMFVREIIFIRLACAGAQETKTRRKENSHKKRLSHAWSNPFQTIFQIELNKCVRLPSISDVQCFVITILQVLELCCVTFSMLP